MLTTAGPRASEDDPAETWTDSDDARPDLTDAATLGCIEHALLPAAWPDCAIQVLRWATADGEVLADVHVFHRYESCAQRFAVLDTPLAEALVSALEAAP